MKGKDFARLEKLTAQFRAGVQLTASEKRQLRKLSAGLAASSNVFKPWRKRGNQKVRGPSPAHVKAARAFLKNPDPLGRI